jgi:hypothetical protein
MLACITGSAAADGIAPPGNDVQATPIALDATSTALTGTTTGATTSKTDPTSVCGDPVAATLWYTLTNVPARNVVLRLVAHGFDGVIAVYRTQGAKSTSVDCEEVDDTGVATMGFAARPGDLVLVGQRSSAQTGTFDLLALVPSSPEPFPGRRLGAVAHASVERYLNETDLWHVGLVAGTTYRISFVSKTDELRLRMYRPGGPPADAREVLNLHSSGSASFTPGPDGGGRYTLLVDVRYVDGKQAYRLQVTRAQRDDTAPGLPLAVGVWRAGRLAPSAVDQLDMYRFVLATPSDVIVRLGRPWPRDVSLLLLRDTGKSVAAGRAVRRPLKPGTYFVVVRAPTGSRATPYRLLLRERGISTLTATGVAQRHIELGKPVRWESVIGKPAGRIATLEIDRLDPLEGWLFMHSYSLRVGDGNLAALTWEPAHVGTYRARITAPSRSAYVYVTVDDRVPSAD